ncbi:membrane protein [Spirochaetia bacterium]|nr:membrane protein [Spirochaetia bacterium]
MALPLEGSLALRRRSSWEAVDAGLLLWRENILYFLPFFAIPFWICAFALYLLPARLETLSGLILWWLKPLFDRAILHVISVRFFESGAGVKRLCRGLGTSLCRGLAGDLLWRRFSPLRAAMMPVRVLENTPRRKISDRRQTLRKGGIGFCSFLTFWSCVVGTVLLCGELLFYLIMAEIIQGDIISSLNEWLKNNGLVIFAINCFNIMLIETIYVCMGFSLYLNSRVEVEGWDIEIMFRGFGETRKRKNLLPVMLLVCLCLGMFGPVKSFAEAHEPAGPAVEAPLETLRAVLDSPDFGGERDSWGIRLKKQPEFKRREMPDLNIAPWLEKLRQIFAFTLRLILISLIAGALGFLLFYLRKTGWFKTAPKDDTAMRSLRETFRESPDSLLEKAARYFERGELRLAWGYCAAAAIHSWPLYRGIVFPPNATEYDCIDIVRSASISANGTAALVSETETFSVLVKHWVNLAYGGRLPPEGSFEEALAFCKSLRAKNG